MSQISAFIESFQGRSQYVTTLDSGDRDLLVDALEAASAKGSPLGEGFVHITELRKLTKDVRVAGGLRLATLMKMVARQEKILEKLKEGEESEFAYCDSRRFISSFVTEPLPVSEKFPLSYNILLLVEKFGYIMGGLESGNAYVGTNMRLTVNCT